MASINMDSILAKAKAHMATDKRQNEIKQKASNAVLNGSASGNVHSIYEAAGKFISVLQSEIQSSGLSAGAMAAISQIDHGSAAPLGDGKYMIHIYFSGDSSRPSLDTAQYGGIDDIVLLFNNGVDHTMRPVHGMWHGHETWSRTVIPGAKFIESAIQNFMSNYASEYNVIDITANGINS